MNRIPLRQATALSLLLSAAACQQPLSTDARLKALVSHQHKMEVILADLHQDCDSSVEATLKYRTDSLINALEHPVEVPQKPEHKHGSATGSHQPHPVHHTHQKSSHHH